MAEKREWNPEEADLEAKMAADELQDYLQVTTPSVIPHAAVSWLADWWRRHYLICGHKRLARVLMGIK